MFGGQHRDGAALPDLPDSSTEAITMRRLAVLAILVLTGCQNVVGPLQPRRPMRVDDPLVSVPEQERRARDRLALPDESPGVAPLSPAVPPGGSQIPR